MGNHGLLFFDERKDKIMDNQYPSNSDRRQGEYTSKHVKSSVTTGNVVQKPSTLLDQIREFFGLNECHTFRDYVSTIGDMTNRVYGAIDTLMGNRVNAPTSTVPGARIAYGSYYNPQQPQAQPPQSNIQCKLQTLNAYSNLEFDLRVDAEIVLTRMYELLQVYPYVSVGDMLDLAGVSDPNGYTNQKYGWTDISGARVVQYGNKYRIVGLSAPMILTQ